MFGSGKRRYKIARLAKPVRRGRPRAGILKRIWLMLLLAAAGLLALFPSTFEQETAAVAQNSPALVGMAVRPMPICGSGKRVTCVVDGDTFWISGEKVRLESIDAPEVNGACARERELAQRATRRLSEILAGENFRLVRNGQDRYRRTLARVETRSGEAGAILVREGLAQRWNGRKAQWCSGNSGA
jgi:micrococcal nuclease